MFFEKLLNVWQAIEPVHQGFTGFAVFDAAPQLVTSGFGQPGNFSSAGHGGIGGLMDYWIDGLLD